MSNRDQPSPSATEMRLAEIVGTIQQSSDAPVSDTRTPLGNGYITNNRTFAVVTVAGELAVRLSTVRIDEHEAGGTAHRLHTHNSALKQWAVIHEENEDSWPNAVAEAYVFAAYDATETTDQFAEK